MTEAAAVQKPDEMGGQPDRGRREWWERVAGVDDEDLPEVDVENAVVQEPTPWWQHATGVMKHRPFSGSYSRSNVQDGGVATSKGLSFLELAPCCIVRTASQNMRRAQPCLDRYCLADR